MVQAHTGSKSPCPIYHEITGLRNHPKGKTWSFCMSKINLRHMLNSVRKLIPLAPELWIQRGIFMQGHQNTYSGFKCWPKRTTLSSAKQSKTNKEKPQNRTNNMMKIKKKKVATVVFLIKSFIWELLWAVVTAVSRVISWKMGVSALVFKVFHITTVCPYLN